MSTLPANWAVASVLDCSRFVRGVTYTKPDAHEHSRDGFIPIIRANNIQSGKFDFADLVHVPEHLVSGDQVLRLGDIVIATSSGSISVVGKAAQLQQPRHMSFGAFCGALRPHPSIHARYLGHFFSSKAYRDAVSEMARGVNINNLKRDHFQAINIPLAPLPEQQRIADKLDTVMARVDSVNDRLARVAPMLKRFRQSVLAAAMSGRLTADWHKSAVCGDWQSSKLSALCKSISDGDHQAPPQCALGVPFITISAINDGQLNLSKATRAVPDEYFDSLDEKRKPTQGDVLYSVTGSIGIPAIVDTNTRFAFQRHIAILRPDPSKVSTAFLYYLMGSELVRAQALAVATGTAQLTIPLKGLRAFEVNLPDPTEQAEIVRRVDLLFSFASRLEARLQAAQAAATRLTPSLLAKAFRGELVPQDPNDEPASELLRRLTQAKPGSPAKGRKRQAA